MIKKSVMMSFLSIFIAFPVLSENCNPDFSLIPPCSQVTIHYQWRYCERRCTKWRWNWNNTRRICEDYFRICDNNNDRNWVSEDVEPWEDAVIDNNHSDLNGFYPLSPFSLYYHRSGGFDLFGWSEPYYIYLSQTLAARRGCIVAPSTNNQNQFLIRSRANEFRITKVIYQNPENPDEIIDLCDPPPPCPDLNLRITGTVLPARRGTVRVTGDWCKSLGCGTGILK